MIQSGLEGNEYVSMLSWIMNTYTGEELMQHPELNIDTSTLGPLLNNDVIEKLQQQYLKVSSSLISLCTEIKKKKDNT